MRNTAMGVGLVFLLVGVLGFIPGIAMVGLGAWLGRDLREGKERAM